MKPSLRVALVLGVAAAWGGDRATAQPPTPPAGPASTYRNPLKFRFGADPWMTFRDGWYYLSTTTGTDIRMCRARRLAELRTTPDQVVFKDNVPSRFQRVWGPNFNRFDGEGGPRWYVYYTAGDGGSQNQRMYVAVSSGDDLMGPYRFLAKLQTDPEDRFLAIDGEVLQMPNGALYFAWCGKPSATNQGIYISRMANPWTLVGPRIELPADGFGCALVREAPSFLRRGDSGPIFLVYSTCSTDTPDYKLGILSILPNADPMNPASWRQLPEPAFARDDRAGVYGPGTSSFFRSPDGQEDWIAYHAKAGTAQTFDDRTTRAQKFFWRLDGTPDFGRPLPLGAELPAPSGEPPPSR